MIQTKSRPSTKALQPLSFPEFVALMACMSALTALSIDAMLPALADIAHGLGAQGANDGQLVISAIFFGLSLGQIFYGPLSDSTGRKPAIYAGIAIYGIGCLLALFAQNFQVMLIGRFLQGIGVAGPNSVAIALVRDQYAGRDMARVMSFVMTVFILIPIVAPLLGQGILLFAHWRGIFALYLILALLVGGWLALRQPETLPVERRVPFQTGPILAAFQEVFRNRTALGYTVMAGLTSGAFVGYLNSAPQIFQTQYGLGAQFPFYFATLALALGGSSYLNAQLVMRFGMESLSRWALLSQAGLSLLYLVLAWRFTGQPPLWSLMAYLLLSFFAVGILFGNLNAQAMEPLGHIAGVGAAVVGAFSTLISTLIGGLIGQSYNGSVLPLVGGFALTCLLAWGVMRWTESRRVDARSKRAAD